jgi:hypothetical protein
LPNLAPLGTQAMADELTDDSFQVGTDGVGDTECRDRGLSRISGLQVRRSGRERADTAQHAGESLSEFDVTRLSQRIDNRGELTRREDDVHATWIDIQPRVISWIGCLFA